jgi:hypothetical protein
MANLIQYAVRSAQTGRTNSLEAAQQLLANAWFGIKPCDNRLSLRPEGVRQCSQVLFGSTTQCRHVESPAFVGVLKSLTTSFLDSGHRIRIGEDIERLDKRLVLIVREDYSHRSAMLGNSEGFPRTRYAVDNLTEAIPGIGE